MNLLFSAPLPSLTHIIKSNKSVVMETASGARRGNIFSHIFLTCLAIFSLSIVKNTILEHSRCAKEKKKKLFFASGMNSHWQWNFYEICVLFAMIIMRRTSEEYSRQSYGIITSTTKQWWRLWFLRFYRAIFEFIYCSLAEESLKVFENFFLFLFIFWFYCLSRFNWAIFSFCVANLLILFR